ncbi:hypothetical protein MPK70_gp286 [Erwinia phage pEa_SNUABM_33]|uniref:Uncharacterized protein n=1 Tax=Erwinia phage pEa_SNUABM_33 TaxID=2869556 RepID=A0AAE7XKW7_9CAUD|nr:hypothetical protein MPK70_gp286 [Erwinia phage pEa_SNUABM_33]QZE58162.1 hypothetical protein pEaSNUABM33_00286 [Erwinia phage pEa_SNUABM_33]
MIRQMPLQLLSKDPDVTAQSTAARLGLVNYTIVVRGDWQLICGTGVDRKPRIALIGPYKINPDLTGVHILTHAGFSDIDALLALGLHRNDLRRMQKEHRARVKAVKEQKRMGNTTALDDIKGK